MHVSTLVLCDAATVRENLLHVLGGGVTYITRPSYPAPLLCDIGLILNHRGSVDIELNVALREVSKPEVLSAFDVSLSASMAEGTPPNAHGSVAIPIDARMLAIPAAGNYSFTATVKGGKGLTVFFAATEDPSLPRMFDATI